jgi:hypothetical protein
MDTCTRVISMSLLTLIPAFLTVFGSCPRHIKYVGHREVDEKCLESLNGRPGGGSRRPVGKNEEVLHGVK